MRCRLPPEQSVERAVTFHCIRHRMRQLGFAARGGGSGLLDRLPKLAVEIGFRRKWPARSGNDQKSPGARLQWRRNTT
jgi:hypothetical protein